MIKQVGRSLGRSTATAAAALLLLTVPAFAQDAANAPEYGQGAGVTRARTLPRTGDGSQSVSGTVLPAAGAGALLVLAAGAAVTMRRRTSRQVVRA
jgi:MYXO-CTERM domain-containing protein